MIDKLEKIQCTGCGACYNACPQNCIQMQPDEKGFLYPVIVQEKCIACGKCDGVCPSVNKVSRPENAEVPETWAAWSLNAAIRYESTSGGIFSELALKTLNNAGVVCGAKYNARKLVEHCIIEHVEELSLIRQSKYIQSDTKKVFFEIEKYLKNEREVLFCGTPCECAGLLNYLQKEYNNLICVDFICRGANSPKVFELFLASLEEQFSSKVNRVWFKNKVLGWRKFSTRIEFEDGQVYSEDRYSDVFIRGYIEANLYMRDCCEVCQYKTMPRLSDITLGDFWGIKSEELGADTDGGTSVVMLNSDKGRVFFEGIKPNLFLKQRSFSEACKGNKCILSSPHFHKEKEAFWKEINSMNIIENIKRFCKVV